MGYLPMSYRSERPKKSSKQHKLLSFPLVTHHNNNSKILGMAIGHREMPTGNLPPCWLTSTVLQSCCARCFRRKRHQQSYLILGPVCYHTDLAGRLCPLEQQHDWAGWLQLSDCIWGWCHKREFHAWYYNLCQKSIAKESIDLMVEPAVVIC